MRNINPLALSLLVVLPVVFFIDPKVCLMLIVIFFFVGLIALIAAPVILAAYDPNEGYEENVDLTGPTTPTPDVELFIRKYVGDSSQHIQ